MVIPKQVHYIFFEQPKFQERSKMGFTLVRQPSNNNLPFSDLTNNYTLFHNHYSQADISKFDWMDHAPMGYYSNHSHIDELMDNLPVDYMNREFVVRVPISYIYSSEEELGGYDRPYWTRDHGDRICRINLNVPNGDGKPKGFSPKAAGVLSGWLRPCGNGKYILVKDLGNNRVWNKLLAGKGQDTEVIMNVRFHDEADLETYMEIESENHTTDAGNRSTQNEHQKFVSSFRANRLHAVQCYDYIRSKKLDYKKIMEIDGVKTPNEAGWLELRSLSGLKEGSGNGFFKKYGDENVNSAIDTMRDIAINTTGDTVLNAETIRSFSIMYSIWTNYGIKKNSSPVFTKEQLNLFFKVFFKKKNPEQTSMSSDMDLLDDSEGSFPLNTISVSVSIKDPVLICAKYFWPSIVTFYKKLNKVKIGFTADCYAADQFVKMSDDIVRDNVLQEMRKKN